jgi:hypothetical protein
LLGLTEMMWLLAACCAWLLDVDVWLIACWLLLA